MNIISLHQLLSSWSDSGLSNNQIADKLITDYKFKTNRWTIVKAVGFLLNLDEVETEQGEIKIKTKFDGKTKEIEVLNSDEPLESIEDFMRLAGLDAERFELSGDIKTGYSQVTMKVDQLTGERNSKGEPVTIQQPLTVNNYNGSAKFRLKPEAMSVLDKKRIAEIKASINSKPISFSHLEEDFQTWIVIGCIHRPFHNKHLWDGLLSLINRIQPTGLIINGDYLDLQSLSSHSNANHYDGYSLQEEYEDGLKGILELEQALTKKAKRVFHYGNHEERYLREIKSLRGCRYGSALISPEEALHLSEYGYDVQTNWKQGYTTLGKNLDVFHGIYFGANPVKSHLDKIPDRKVLFNHTHRIDYHRKGNYEGWNTGCLINLNHKEFGYADRFQKAAWVNGFAVVNVDKSNEVHTSVVRGLDNYFFFDGRRYGQTKLIAV